MTTSKGGRPAKPAPKWNADRAVWQVRVTLPKPEGAKPDDDAPRKVIDLPNIGWEDEARAKRVALLASDCVRRGEAVPLGVDETVAQWFTRYYDAAADGTIGRKNRGAPQVSAGDRRARFMKWIAPIIGSQPMARVTSDALRPVVKRLDAEIRTRAKFYDAGEKQEKGRKPGLAAKAARNIWGELTAAFREASTSKHDDLRVRSDDPTRGVQPPSSAEEREQAALYPSEVLALLSAPSETVPPYRRALYAVAGYAGLRVGELRGLTAEDVDLEHDVINVRRQNRAGKGSARTKTRAGRRQVPIEPTLRPLLEALMDHSEDGKPLLRVPPPEDCAELVRRDLLAAGCDREELFADDGERSHFTFHGLRHTCLTHWAVAGRPLPWLLSAAGHTSYEVTQRYIDAGMVMRGSFGQPHPPMPPGLLLEVSDGSGIWTPKQWAKSPESLRPQRELNPCYRRERPVS
jgi:integrase